MLTHKSSQLIYRPAQTTLQLQVSTQGAFIPQSTRLFPNRPRKIHQTNPLKKAKLLKLIEDSDLFDPKTPGQRSSSAENTVLDRKQKISSYLAYKKQQQIMKMHHSSKVNYLRSRYLQANSAKNNRNQTKSAPLTCQSPTKKSSMSKVNLVLDSRTNTPSGIKVRQFYLKTSQGRRQRVSPSQYQIRMMSKLGKSQQKGFDNSWFSRLSQYSEGAVVFSLNQGTPVFSSRTTHNRLRIKHGQNRSNAFLGRGEDRLGQCRPWTSSKSQYGE